MVKKVLYFLMCIILLLFEVSASEAGDFYVSYFGGVTFVNDSDITGKIENDIREDFGGNIENISLEQSFDTGFGVGGNAGYDFGRLRAEGEISYRRNSLDKFKTTITSDGATASIIENSSGYVSSLSFMANCFLDYENNSRFTPFGGGGIGASYIESHDGSNEDDIVFAYQLGAGLAYAVTKFITLEISYRFLGTSDPELGYAKVEYTTHNIFLGIRFNIL